LTDEGEVGRSPPSARQAERAADDIAHVEAVTAAATAALKRGGRRNGITDPVAYAQAANDNKWRLWLIGKDGDRGLSKFVRETMPPDEARWQVEDAINQALWNALLASNRNAMAMLDDLDKRYRTRGHSGPRKRARKSSGSIAGAIAATDDLDALRDRATWRALDRVHVAPREPLRPGSLMDDMGLGGEP